MKYLSQVDRPTHQQYRPARSASTKILFLFSSDIYRLFCLVLAEYVGYHRIYNLQIVHPSV